MMPLALFFSLLFAFSLVSRRLEGTIVTAPMVFTTAGMLMFPALPRIMSAGFNKNVFLRLAEIGLVLLLFTDASRTELDTLRSIGSLPVRLLSIGMLLTIAFGAVVARLVFPQLSLLEAGILSTILAPTDAGLGQVVVNSSRVPLRVREALNVEAGLNDGLSVPFLLFFIALAAARIEGGAASLTQFIGEQLGFGALVGLTIGLGGGWLMGFARRVEWLADSYQQIGVVALALLCLAVSEIVGASMFIASFIAGLAVQSRIQGCGQAQRRVRRRMGATLQSFRVLSLWRAGGAGLAAVQQGIVVVCRSKPDGDPDVAGSNRAHRSRSQLGERSVYRLVWSARPGLDRSRSGLSGAGNELARRAGNTFGSDGNCVA